MTGPKIKATEFTEIILTKINETGIGVTDAVLRWCEENNFDETYGGSLVKRSPEILALMTSEAEANNNLKKS